MQRSVLTALLASALATGAAVAAPLNLQMPDPNDRPAVNPRYPGNAVTPSTLGGGFIEMLFGGGRTAPSDPYAGRYQTARGEPPEWAEARSAEADPRYQRQVVAYQGTEQAGTIIIDTPR